MNRPVAHCLLSCVLGVTSAGADRPPNIVFIFADDMGYGDLNCHRGDAFRSATTQANGELDVERYWRGKVHTPNLDRMAAEGTDFQQFMVCSPVCSPSRVAAMTGHFPSRHRVHQHFASHADNVERGMPDFLDPSVPMLPRMLSQAGYRTGHFGKWHLSGGGIKNAPSTDQYGFDESAVYVGPGPHVFTGTKYAGLAETAQRAEPASYLSIAATDHAVEFIRKSAGEPFYVNLWLHETHHVVSARGEDRVHYKDVPEPYQTYYGAVTRADAQVGRILDVIDELGLDEQTLIIFSSDNGPEVFNPRLQYSVGSTAGMRGRKRSLMMGGLCVPFIVRWSGQIPAGRVDQQSALSAVDLLPTLLAITGALPPSDYSSDGINVVSAFKGQTFHRAKPMFWFWQGNHDGENWPVFACRDQDWGLLVDDANDRYELYDLAHDRYQQNDLSKRESDRVRAMKRAIEQWRLTLPELPILAAAPAGKPKTKASIDRKAVFARKDTNHDGFLSLEEFSPNIDSPPPPETRFKRFDTDSDGRLTEGEFAGQTKN